MFSTQDINYPEQQGIVAMSLPISANSSRIITYLPLLDSVPIIGTAKNLIDIFLKSVLHFRDAEWIKKSYYFTHLNEKSFERCFALCLPVLGSIGLFIYDSMFSAARSPRLDATGTIYIQTMQSGSIIHDRHFKFAERLRDGNNNPIEISPSDFYLELQGDFEKGKEFLLRDNYAAIYLPSTLFEGVKEGEKVRFIIDEHLIELTCRQSAHPASRKKTSSNFEDVFEMIHKSVQKNPLCLWKEDTEGDFSFQNLRVATPLYQIKFGTVIERTPIENFNAFKRDQEMHGPYIELLGEALENGWFFEVHQDRMALSDIQVIQAGTSYLWIIIPHQPEKNQWPKGATELLCNYGNGLEKVFYEGADKMDHHGFIDHRHAFTPSRGDRLTRYKHGQYAVISFDYPLEQVDLFFNDTGWLQLSFKSK